ncbi:MAG TPA: hypothetical protein VE955_00495 [Candidatus Dormibacteraeota bacterium]|nr:hypothetical protein [Candidatus Dormibacteraeota bacterium]
MRSLARLLYLVGGILLILSAVLDVGIGLRSLLNFAPSIPSLGSLAGVILAIVVGVVALVGMGQVSNPAWNVILLILGFLAGGLGGLLVMVGAIVGLVAFFI